VQDKDQAHGPKDQSQYHQERVRYLLSLSGDSAPQCLLHLLRHFPSRLPEFLHSLAQTSPEFRKFPGTEENEDNGQNEDYLVTTNNTGISLYHGVYRTRIRVQTVRKRASIIWWLRDNPHSDHYLHSPRCPETSGIRERFERGNEGIQEGD